MSRWIAMVLLLGGLALSAGAESVVESARRIPLVGEVDVVVVGGSSAGVAAAQAAAEEGASVFLVAPRAYLGEDMAGTLRLWLEEGETPSCALAKSVFGDERHVTPLKAKARFDEALLSANVRFLTHSFFSDVLVDGSGHIGGVVTANRSGRQAITCKVVIDATERGTVARAAGAAFTPYPAGPRRFQRVVLTRDPQQGEGLTYRSLLQVEVPKKKKEPEVPLADMVEYTFDVPMADGSWQSFAEAEQVARDLTFDPMLYDAADTLFQVPPDTLHSKGAFTGEWTDADAVALSAFQPASVERVWVLGGCAEMPRAGAEKMLRPCAFMAMGSRLGAAVARQAKALAPPKAVHLPGMKNASDAAADAGELLFGMRAIASDVDATVPAAARELPVLRRYEVVVVGGGTGGAPAGIGAARSGAKTLLLEYLHELGGVGTVGLIGNYWYGNRAGFTTAHDRGVQAMNAKVHVVAKAEWWRRENRRAGGTVWLGVLGCGAYVEGNVVRGVVVATPHGRGVVLSDTVVDSTGNGDVAIAAGAAYRFVDDDEPAVQGAGLGGIKLGHGYLNSDFTFSEDTSVVDAWQSHVFARYLQQGRGLYDTSQLLDTRERRRIVGEYTLTPMDIALRRTFPDTISQASSNFDTHGFTVHPFFFLHPDAGGGALKANVPFRCFVPREIDNILVTGLGISAHRDAMPVIRMQPDVQSHGYAMGIAAAMAVQAKCRVRDIDVKALQKRLCDEKQLTEDVLEAVDSLPYSQDRIAAAVIAAGAGYADVAIVLAHAEQALPLLHEAYGKAPPLDLDYLPGVAEGICSRGKDAWKKVREVTPDKLVYAHILGILGDDTGTESLIAAVRAMPWGSGWEFKGMGQGGASFAWVDSLVIALGRTGRKEALEPILEKARELHKRQHFSHHRAVALACESLKDPAAAPVLAELLRKDDMMGHAVAELDKDYPAYGQKKWRPGRDTFASIRSAGFRTKALKEISIARALYRCGDYEGLGRQILERYTKDLRGPLARHACAVLYGEAEVSSDQ